MRNLRLVVAGTLLLVLALPLGAYAAPAAEARPCDKKELTWTECLDELLAAARTKEAARSEQEKTRSKSEATNQLDAAVRNKPTAVEALGGGLGLRDFLPRFASALGLGNFTEKDGAVTLTFNPKLTDFEKVFGSKLSFQTVQREPEPFATLVAAVPEADRKAFKERLAGDLGNLDDVEAKVTWTFENEKLGRSLDPHSEDLDRLFENAFEAVQADVGDEGTLALLKVLEQHPEMGNLNEAGAPSKLWESSEKLAKEVTAAMAKAAAEMAARDVTFQTRLESSGFFRIADLVNNQPQLYFTGSYRYRDERAGPADWSIEGVYELPMGQSLNKARKNSEGNIEDLNDLKRYFDANPAGGEHGHRLTVKAKVSEVRPYDFADEDVTLSLDSSRVVSASLEYGYQLWADAKEGDKVGGARVEVKANWDDATDDPKRNDRFTSSLTFTQVLYEDVSLSIGAIYASKPEYRDEVDHELSARFGLRFKVDKPEKKK